MKNILIIFLAVLFLSSCSGPGVRPLTSEEKDLYLKLDPNERARRKQAEYYRKLREKNWNDYLKSGKKIDKGDYVKWWKRTKKQQAMNTSSPKRVHLYEPDIPAPAPTPAPKPGWESKEVRIQSNQMLSYYCMKHRKDDRFDDEGSCQNFTQDVLSNCQNKHQETPSTNFVRCIKSGLRK